MFSNPLYIMNIEGATFILRTADLAGYVGTVNNIYGSSYTWKSVDIRSILGTLWDDYDYYNIGLVSNASNILGNAGVFVGLADEKMGTIYMSGFNWINANYDIKTRTFKPEAPIGFVNFSPVTTSLGNVIQYNALNVSSFCKSTPIVDITISFRDIITDTISTCATGTTFPAQSFMFEIIPIKKENMSFNSKRITL